MAVHSADGTRIAYDQVGAGPPVVLVLGAFGDRETPKALAARLARRFTVFSYDRRGRGKSTDTFPWSIDREVEDLEAIIGEAGGSAAVYGQDSGACLALHAAAHHSGISRLVAFEPPYIEDASRPRHKSDLVQRLEELIVFGRRDQAVELYLTESVGLTKEAVNAIKVNDFPTWQRMRSLAQTLPYEVALTNNQAIPGGVLPKIEIPTLLVAGSASPEWAQSAITAVAGQIPGADTMVLEGQHHAVSDDAIAPVLEKFFS